MTTARGHLGGTIIRELTRCLEGCDSTSPHQCSCRSLPWRRCHECPRVAVSDRSIGHAAGTFTAREAADPISRICAVYLLVLSCFRHAQLPCGHSTDGLDSFRESHTLLRRGFGGGHPHFRLRMSPSALRSLPMSWCGRRGRLIILPGSSDPAGGVMAIELVPLCTLHVQLKPPIVVGAGAPGHE